MKKIKKKVSKKNYKKITKFYAVKVLEFEAETKQQLIDRYLDSPDPKPIIIKGIEIEPKITF